ncbi:ComEA family DNA-binding protein [Sulfurimonas microaerophilic]|uniref:ComEA family DNA-binding protein n=1 Tax=Sulfurimonas microaerophilic TaxID=3058392 RepID=UPI0027153CF2|nr:helix-hairpin-helix domain-containing protein [Sulfurimonas sp. hsl 1-7]
MKVLLSLLIGFSFLFSSVDINNADKSQLMQLKGVGAKKADSIITYREAHCFTNIAELEKVKGLGKKFIEKNKDNISVGACKK